VWNKKVPTEPARRHRFASHIAALAKASLRQLAATAIAR